MTRYLTTFNSDGNVIAMNLVSGDYKTTTEYRRAVSGDLFTGSVVEFQVLDASTERIIERIQHPAYR